MMSYSPSGQTDDFRCNSSINAKRFNIGAVIAAFWRAVTADFPLRGESPANSRALTLRTVRFVT
jgi:hypothetical protein